MNKLIALYFFVIFSLAGFSQDSTNTLDGSWRLDEIIDVMTGDVIQPNHKTSEDFKFYIKFNNGVVNYNLEINSCSNEYTIEEGEKLTKISFTYFSTCTEICCDHEFSELLTYDKVSEYYIKKGEILVLLSKERIFYFSREAPE